MIQVEELTVSAQNKRIIHDISFNLQAGDWLMVIGPNGAGKSTIVKTIAGVYPYQGNIQLFKRNIKTYSSKEKAQLIGILSQNRSLEYNYTVNDIVELGRYPYQSPFNRFFSKEDRKIIDHALEITGMIALRNQSMGTLSGGEIQRTFLAQLFAQNPNILILDEPTNHLDIQYEESIFKLVSQWLLEGNRAVISIVHDLSIAKQYSNKALLLDKGRVVAYGKSQDVLSAENLNKVYDLNVPQYLYRKYSIWKIGDVSE